MKVLIFSTEDCYYKSEAEVSELNYESDNNFFWMRCVMGDDWFQQVRSSLDFAPNIIRFSNQIIFVLFNLNSEAEQFKSWLVSAEKKYAKAIKQCADNSVNESRDNY